MKDRLAKAFFALVGALIFISAPAKATVTITMDGVWWQGLSDREKVVAVQGMIEGIESGYALGHINGWGDTIGIFKLTPTGTDAIKLGAGNPPEFSKTFGIYVDEINLWYKGHSKTSMKPNFLLSNCLSDKPWFSTAICEKLASDSNK